MFFEIPSRSLGSLEFTLSKFQIINQSHFLSTLNMTRNVSNHRHRHTDAYSCQRFRFFFLFSDVHSFRFADMLSKYYRDDLELRSNMVFFMLPATFCNKSGFNRINT